MSGKSAMDHIRVGKGEHFCGVRQKRALFPRGVQEHNPGSGQGHRQGNPGISGTRAEIQDPSGKGGKPEQEEGIQDLFDRDLLRLGDRRKTDRPVPARWRWLPPSP